MVNITSIYDSEIDIDIKWLNKWIILCSYRLLEEIDKHTTLIVIGETGSGKTTQIPQFVHDITLEKDKMIAITQVDSYIYFYLF